MNGDSFLGTDLHQLTSAHSTALASPGSHVLATLALARLDDGSRYGSVELATGGAIVGFVEKRGLPGAGLINAGIYVVERELIESIPERRAVSLERDVFPLLLDGRLRGIELDGPFVDIGVPESYAALDANPSILDAIGPGGAG
jgi:NDP-sugar pyrophosphorylase family protein